MCSNRSPFDKHEYSPLCVIMPLHFILLLLLLLLFNLTANGFLPGGSGTTRRHNTQKCTYHTKYHTTLKPNTAHKATQTMKDTLRTMNTTQKKKVKLSA
jgi:hypothetical protein